MEKCTSCSVKLIENFCFILGPFILISTGFNRSATSLEVNICLEFESHKTQAICTPGHSSLVNPLISKKFVTKVRHKTSSQKFVTKIRYKNLSQKFVTKISRNPQNYFYFWEKFGHVNFISRSTDLQKLRSSGKWTASLKMFNLNQLIVNFFCMQKPLEYSEVIDLSSENKYRTFPPYPIAAMGASGALIDNKARSRQRGDTVSPLNSYFCRKWAFQAASPVLKKKKKL